MLITNIIPQKRKKERVNIYLDGKFAFSLDLETLLTKGLKINQEVSQEEVEELIKKGELNKLYKKVLRLISLRPRSEKEIIDYLRKNGAGQNEIDLVTERLKKLGLIDDVKFINWWFEQRKIFRPRSLQVIKAELLRKGVNKLLIEKTLSGKEADFNNETARILAKKALKRYRNLPIVKRKQRLSNFLLQKGFNWCIIQEIVDEMIPVD